MEPLEERIADARAVLIAGPTASGKSALALRLAEASARRGRAAMIVNADAMQVYDALHVLTARPGTAEEARAPHRLYGHVSGTTRYSVGAWLRDVEDVLRAAEATGRLLILAGGTGLYFKGLTEGLAAMPDIPAAIREKWAGELTENGPAFLHDRLAEVDPVAARRIRTGDPQRLLRALEVFEATGMSLIDWQATASGLPLLPLDQTAALVLEPERGALYRNVEARLDRMVAQGALREVETLLERRLRPDLPVMKAIGVRAFGSVLRNEMPLASAVAQAKAETRRYAKRQMTWFRNQMRDWERLSV